MRRSGKRNHPPAAFQKIAGRKTGGRGKAFADGKAAEDRKTGIRLPIIADRRSRSRGEEWDHISKKELVRWLAEGAFLCVLLDYLFYESIYGLIILVPGMYFYIKWKRSQRERKQKNRINREFKAALDGIGSFLQAGYSIENAFQLAVRDLSGELPPESILKKNLLYMESQRQVSVPLEELFLELGYMTGLEDIENFSEVFRTACKTGGNLFQIFRRSSRMIGDKLEVEEEIQALLAAKKNEQMIMNLMPSAIILYLKLVSPGFLGRMYGNLPGGGIMTGFLLLYIGAWYLGVRILDITV